MHLKLPKMLKDTHNQTALNNASRCDFSPPYKAVCSGGLWWSSPRTLRSGSLGLNPSPTTYKMKANILISL